MITMCHCIVVPVNVSFALRFLVAEVTCGSHSRWSRMTLWSWYMCIRCIIFQL